VQTLVVQVVGLNLAQPLHDCLVGLLGGQAAADDHDVRPNAGLQDRIDRKRDELDVKAAEHDAEAAGGEGVDVLGFAWWRPGRPGWPSSMR
jgi:hypothetical protein